MSAHIKALMEFSQMLESAFVLDQIIRLDMKLTLTQGSCYVELPKWIAKEKIMINPKVNDKPCGKLVVIAAFYHEEIAKNPQRISKLQRSEDQYNCNGVGYPLAIHRIGKF